MSAKNLSSGVVSRKYSLSQENPETLQNRNRKKRYFLIWLLCSQRFCFLYFSIFNSCPIEEWWRPKSVRDVEAESILACIVCVRSLHHASRDTCWCLTCSQKHLVFLWTLRECWYVGWWNWVSCFNASYSRVSSEEACHPINLHSYRPYEAKNLLVDQYTNRPVAAVSWSQVLNLALEEGNKLPL